MREIAGTVREIFVEEGITYAHVSIGGLKEKVSLTLLMNARVGDEVRVESGVAMAATSRTSRALVAEAFE